jgi:hypothetical protein
VSIRNPNGTIVSQATLMGYMTDVTPTQNKVYQYNGPNNLFRAHNYDGNKTFETGADVRYVVGQTYRLDDINNDFPTATFVSCTPNNPLPAAGGTTVTILGTGFSGVTSVTFGGVAGTGLVVVSDSKLTVVTPAKTAGTYPLVIVDDATASASLSGGNVTFV